MIFLLMKKYLQIKYKIFLELENKETVSYNIQVLLFQQLKFIIMQHIKNQDN